MRQRKTRFGIWTLSSVLLLQWTACKPESAANSLGEAYVAPATLNLHSNLSSKSVNVAVLKHGDRLLVLDIKRRYVKVQTERGIQGWLDSRQLLSKEQMTQLRQDSERERHLASEGHANTFDVLNIHIEPDRRSAAFAQIAAGDSVDVLAHKAVPKTAGNEPLASSSFMKAPSAAPMPARHKGRSKTQKAVSLRPPMPAAPKPPDNWQELSAERIDAVSDTVEAKKPEPPKAQKSTEKPPIVEDWVLIRTKDQKVGWVLARSLYMAIPDEVAQYAEGQRISSYFDLGAVQDEEKGTKHNWLWTTSAPGESYDFDRFRVFYWNRRRHRYETSYRQRDLTGYFPVEVEPAQPGATQRYFSLILQNDNGSLMKKRYAFEGSLVHLVSAEPYQAPAENGPTKARPLEVEKMEAKRPEPSWFQKQAGRVRHLFRH